MSEAAPRLLDPATAPARRRGRPRNQKLDLAIREAARELLIEEGFTRLRLEHVAARAGVGKATIYRRWRSKDALALDLLMELASPHIHVFDVGDTRTELLQTVENARQALTETPFGPVIRTLLSQIAVNASIGDPFRAAIVQARRDEVGRIVARGVARGDLRPDAAADLATELLVGPVYFRLVFGGQLDAAFARGIVDAYLRGFAAR
ncbi:MAG TPA: TetR/AcrR family transcriptional regulator [Candidatus Limnocylindrales bacterium]